MSIFNTFIHHSTLRPYVSLRRLSIIPLADAQVCILGPGYISASTVLLVLLLFFLSMALRNCICFSHKASVLI